MTLNVPKLACPKGATGGGGIEIFAGDDAAWIEVCRKAVAVARALAHAPPTVRLSKAEAARVSGVARAIAFRWRIRFEVDIRNLGLLVRHQGRPRRTNQIERNLDDLIDAPLRSYCLLPKRRGIRSLVHRVHLTRGELRLPRRGITYDST